MTRSSGRWPVCHPPPRGKRPAAHRSMSIPTGGCRPHRSRAPQTRTAPAGCSSRPAAHRSRLAGRLHPGGRTPAGKLCAASHAASARTSKTRVSKRIVFMAALSGRSFCRMDCGSPNYRRRLSGRAPSPTNCRGCNRLPPPSCVICRRSTAAH